MTGFIFLLSIMLEFVIHINEATLVFTQKSIVYETTRFVNGFNRKMSIVFFAARLNSFLLLYNKVYLISVIHVIRVVSIFRENTKRILLSLVTNPILIIVYGIFVMSWLYTVSTEE